MFIIKKIQKIMACMTLKGISYDLCDSSIGGIKKVAIYEKSDLALSTMTVVDGEVTALTASAPGFSYDFLKDNSNWVEAIVGDGILASVHFAPTVTLMFRKMSNTLRNEIMELVRDYVVIFVTDSNNITWMIGSDRGMTLSASAGGQSGSKLEEMNGETLVFTGNETFKAYTMDLTAIGEPFLSQLS
jgi:hypothetical protein